MSRYSLYFLIFVLCPCSYAQFTYAPINVPGAVATAARGINNSGEVVGFYQKVACSNSDPNIPNCATKGFKLVNGNYIKLMVPNSVTTAILGVNDQGDLVGFYTKADGIRHGFIWFHQNVVQTIDYPGSQNTIAMGINAAGTVVGKADEGGWVWVNGTFSNMNPGSYVSGSCCESVNAISNNGILVGQVFLADFNQAWLKESYDEDFWKYSGGDTFATAVNNNSDVTGYSAFGGAWFALQVEGNEGAGDAEASPVYKAVQYPNAGTTFPFGMNDSRYLAGAYEDSVGQHGFIAKPTF